MMGAKALERIDDRLNAIQPVLEAAPAGPIGGAWIHPIRDTQPARAVAGPWSTWWPATRATTTPLEAWPPERAPCS